MMEPRRRLMFDELQKHHIGIVIEPQSVPELEQSLGKSFHLDETQETRICFNWNALMDLYVEHLVREGRAARYEPGFHHVCYQVPSTEKMDEIHAFLRREKMGFRLTFPERSGSEECGMITFYQIHNEGIVEFNIPVEEP